MSNLSCEDVVECAWEAVESDEFSNRNGALFFSGCKNNGSARWGWMGSPQIDSMQKNISASFSPASVMLSANVESVVWSSAGATASFPLLLGALQKYTLFPMGVGNSSRVASLTCALTVGFAGLASSYVYGFVQCLGLCPLTSAFMASSGNGNSEDTGRISWWGARNRERNTRFLNMTDCFRERWSDKSRFMFYSFAEMNFLALGSIFVFKVLLRGRFSSLAPSNVFFPGAFANRKMASLPSYELREYATSHERVKIQKFGKTYGCHSCGTKKGPFIADHQPPNKQALDMIAQRYYPQCQNCSQIQAEAVKNNTTALIAHPFSLRLYHSFAPLPFVLPSWGHFKDQFTDNISHRLPSPGHYHDVYMLKGGDNNSTSLQTSDAGNSISANMSRGGSGSTLYDTFTMLQKDRKRRHRRVSYAAYIFCASSTSDKVTSSTSSSSAPFTAPPNPSIASILHTSVCRLFREVLVACSHNQNGQWKSAYGHAWSV
eukprot:Nk52_evm50s1569 gene=Nk52_evmTU50s1569